MGNLLFIYFFIEMKEKIARTNNVNNVNVRYTKIRVIKIMTRKHGIAIF